MTLASFAFYMFATVTVASALMVISARNPVHSVLFLILTFFNSAGIFLLLGAEFLALLLVIVYVGAVAVLFLFVVYATHVACGHLDCVEQRYVEPVGRVVLLEKLEKGAVGGVHGRVDAELQEVVASQDTRLDDLGSHAAEERLWRH